MQMNWSASDERKDEQHQQLFRRLLNPVREISNPCIKVVLLNLGALNSL